MTFAKRHSDVLIVAALAVALRIAFWAFTGRLWEDALTSITNARNAVAGLGLTHHVGEPATHSFTSVLSVLIPLIGEAIAHDGGIVVLRLASLAAAVVTIVAADAIGRQLGLARWARLLVIGYLAVDANHIFYGMTGMETQVAVASLLVSAWAFNARHPATGVALGIALLARPDFLIWAAILVTVQLLRDRTGLARLVGGAALVVAPWIAFATATYGSPIPQTIIAKATAFTTFPTDASLGGWIAWVPEQVHSRISAIGRTVMPFLEDTLAFGAPLPIVVLVVISSWMALLAAVGTWVRRLDQQWAPIILFVAVDLGYRIVFLPTEYHDWYVPPFTAMTIFLVAAGAERVARTPGFRGPALAGAMVAVFALPLPWVFAMERAIQVEIGDGVRAPLARSLGELAMPGETIITEAPGYLGYLTTRLTIMDYPGLTSRTTLAAVYGLPSDRRSYESLIDKLRPDWIVIRPIELDYLRSGYPGTAAQYQEVRRFGSHRTAIERGWYWKVTVDSEFLIMRRSP